MSLVDSQIAPYRDVALFAGLQDLAQIQLLPQEWPHILLLRQFQQKLLDSLQLSVFWPFQVLQYWDAVVQLQPERVH